MPQLFSRRFRRVFSLLLIILVTSVSALIASSWFRVSHAEDGAAGGRPLVFIHGIKGAALMDGAGQTHWLTSWQTLNIGTKALALPMQWNGETQASDDLVPGQILDRVRVVPYVLESPVYGPWLDAARALGRPFYPFAYDWRRDPGENAARFASFLQKVQADHGGQSAQVVAHSLGGLITLAVLNQRPELFHSVYFAGVPFSGGVGFLPDLAEGDSTGLNSRILRPSVVGTFPSYYAFLPLDGSGIVDKSGKSVAVDFYSVADWKKFGWGLFREKGDVEAKEKFLKDALAHARAFRERLVAAKITYPPVTVIASREHPTLAEVLHQGKKFDFKERPKQPGDGRVLEKHSLPPAGIPYNLEYSEADHSGLLNDPKVISLISGRTIAEKAEGKSPSAP